MWKKSTKAVVALDGWSKRSDSEFDMSSKDKNPVAIVSVADRAQRIVRRIVELEQEVSDRQAEIEMLENELNECVGKGAFKIFSDGSEELVETPEIPNDGTYQSRVLALLWDQMGKPFTALRVASLLNIHNVDSARQALKALERDGKVRKVDRGKWAAVALSTTRKRKKEPED